MSNIYDYYDDDYYGYFDDDTKTNDPGQWILIGVSVYSSLCIILLPYLVVCGNRRETRQQDRKECDETQFSPKNVECDHIYDKKDKDVTKSIESTKEVSEHRRRKRSLDDSRHSEQKDTTVQENIHDHLPASDRKPRSIIISFSGDNITDSLVDAGTINLEDSVSLSALVTLQLFLL